MKKKLIYVYPKDATFIRKDIAFLSKKFRIVTQDLNWADKKSVIPNMLIQAFFLLTKIWGSKAVFIMFGGHWSLIPVIFGKLFRVPVYIILGGSDCVAFSELNYGSLRKPLMRFSIKWSYKLATMLLPVDQSLVLSENKYDPQIKRKKQGYLSFFPGIKTPYTVIHNGFDPELWKPEGIEKEPDQFITVAEISDKTRLLLKGADLVIDIARKFPGQRFHIVGIDPEFSASLENIPENVIFHGFLDRNELKLLMYKSRYYLQLSISEGFPNALCEAMLCECIPIGSNVGGIPFIINDTGFIIKHKILDEITSVISEVMNSMPDHLKSLEKKARINIEKRFPISRREKAFMELLSG
jgi:glycosyltransferase involved in cell wall biosynthesis